MNTALQQSSFVTVTAQSSVALSGFCIVGSLLQIILLNTSFFPDTSEVSQIFQAPLSEMSLIALFAFSRPDLLALASLLLSTMVFVSAIGLLKRKNWARVIFIAAMGVGILCNIGGITMQTAVAFSLQHHFAKVPVINALFITTMACCVVVTLGISVLFAWIAKRLMSPGIAAEFGK
ncbi:hypothetical protein LJC47_06890 [Desulfosarcina sp. OttesenSCG-928-B08]|nr:hypothetical protein [Desulfosarcina sp. OttesenSCG-928-B08]